MSDIERNVEFVTTRDHSPWGILLSDAQLGAMTADQLRQAIANYACCVVRRPNGSFNLADLGVNVHDDTCSVCRADLKRRPDGSYEVLKVYEHERRPVLKVV